MSDPIAFLDTDATFCTACAVANDVRDPGTLAALTPVSDSVTLPAGSACYDCSRPLAILRLITAEERVDNVRASLAALTLQERPDPEAVETTGSSSSSARSHCRSVRLARSRTMDCPATMGSPAIVVIPPTPQHEDNAMATLRPLSRPEYDHDQVITNASGLALSVADVTYGSSDVRILERLVAAPTLAERERFADELRTVAKPELPSVTAD